MSYEYKVEHHYYINNFFGEFIRSCAEYFKDNWFPDREDLIISTYHKAIEKYRNRKNKGGERWSPKCPFMVVNPDLNLSPTDGFGKLFHNYPNYNTKLASTLYGPVVYQDDNVKVTPVVNQYRGSMEVILFDSSIYQLIDSTFILNQFFSGQNRYITPTNITGYYVLPDEMLLYEYNNPYTGESYVLDWETYSEDTTTKLIKNINQNKWVYPFTVKPRFSLTSVSDGSSKYGNEGDDLFEARLVANIDWECMLPTHLVLFASTLPVPCHFFQMDIAVNFQYTMASVQANNNVVAPTEFGVLIKDTLSSDFGRTRMLYYKRCYNYTITSNDYDNIQDENNIDIDIGEQLPDCEYLKIYGKYGELERDKHWKLLVDNQTVRLIGFNLKGLSTNNILSFMIYSDTRTS